MNMHVYLAKCPVSSTCGRNFRENSGAEFYSGTSMMKIRDIW